MLKKNTHKHDNEIKYQKKNSSNNERFVAFGLKHFKLKIPIAACQTQIASDIQT